MAIGVVQAMSEADWLRTDRIERAACRLEKSVRCASATYPSGLEVKVYERTDGSPVVEILWQGETVWKKEDAVEGRYVGYAAVTVDNPHKTWENTLFNP